MRDGLETIQSALLPPLPTTAPSGAIGMVEPRFDFRVREAPAREVFQALAAGSRYNWVIHQDVTGNITVDLRGVTVEDALRAIRDGYGYEFSIDANRVTVLPAAIQSRIYQVNYSAAGTGDTFWSQLRDNLRAIVGRGAGREIALNAATGVLVVRGMPVELRQVERYLAAVHAAVGRQIVIEAKFVEVALFDINKSGINWETMEGGSSQSSPRGTLQGFSTRESDFDVLLRQLSRQGETRIVSSLRMTALNNQRAFLRMSDAPTGGSPGAPALNGVELSLTPQIAEDARVTLRLRPLLNASASRAMAESDSVILTRDRTISVISGLLNLDASKTGASRELIILLRPTVVNVEPGSNDVFSAQDGTMMMARPVN